MKDYTEEEITGLLPVIVGVINSKAFKGQDLHMLMLHIEGSPLFRGIDYLDTNDREDVFEDYMDSMSSWEMRDFMRDYGFIFECDMEEPYSASNLMEEQVDELLAQIKLKYDYLPNLERVLGAKLVAEVRGVEYHDNVLEEGDTINDLDRECQCYSVVYNQPEDIIDCALNYGKDCHPQWIGSNTKGNFFVMTCECGKISTPTLTKK